VDTTASNFEGMGSRGSVLLVDDEGPILRCYGRILRQAGFTVDALSDGAHVAKRLAAGDIDVVMSDLNMRGLDGIGVLKVVRADYPEIPVVLITAAGDLGSALKAVEYGALRYLLKPVDSDLLAETALEAVRLRRLSRIQRKAYELFGRDASTADDLESRFDAALQGLHMVFQPVVRWSDRTVFAYEALVRTTEPSLARPDHLFSAAEKLDALHALGRSIRREVAATIEQSNDDVNVFVNLHPRDLDDPDLYDRHAPLTRHASRIVLEITERASLDGIASVTERVRALRDLGYLIALDDLGAGYAGLTSFTKLQPDTVKLDMALIRAIDSEPTKQRLVGTLTALCRDLSMMVVAEGIETVAERDTLVALGCDLFQGYLFARPGAAFPQPMF
jgi:EAL domain-containing protein (putative c-di-GMP-specific phosphodiesterase class I)/ActR/RegA family two-component response regulator